MASKRSTKGVSMQELQKLMDDIRSNKGWDSPEMWEDSISIEDAQDIQIRIDAGDIIDVEKEIEEATDSSKIHFRFDADIGYV